MNVPDDVGCINGYVMFLKGINQKGKGLTNTDWSKDFGNYTNKEESLAWAKGMGWSKRKISCANML